MTGPAARLLAYAAASFGAGAIGNAFIAPNLDWYATLARPHWAPPQWVFGPAWTFLYASMSVAAWRAERAGARLSPEGGLFGVTLVLNAAWPAVFFHLRALGPAFAVLAALEASVLVLLALFLRRDRIAGWLLAPYALWLTYAGALNAAYWRLNP